MAVGVKHFPGKVAVILLTAGAVIFGCCAVQAVSPEQLGLGLVDIGRLDSDIVEDIRYATTDNFSGRILYPSGRCLLRESVAQRLLRVHRDLKKQGMGLKVFDCYRPVDVQRKMWAVFPNPDYVADPASGSRHNRGASVDVGLVDEAGKELPMPSKFDEFSERSHLAFQGGSPEELRNREILQTSMRREGFLSMATEWWHFDSPDWRDYPLVNADARLIPGPEVKQVLAVADPGPDKVESLLWGFEKTIEGWKARKGPFPVVLGRGGVAGFDEKREGDGRTPRGVFALGPVFGYAAAIATRMPYRQATAEDVWIDDSSSHLYNQWVRGIPAVESFEKMRREDNLYQLGVVIRYNADPVVAGRGSAIFLHIWKGPGQPTSGCIAMAPADLAAIVHWLDPEHNPWIVLGF